MANGGHICCERCTYNPLTLGMCDVLGIATNQFKGRKERDLEGSPVVLFTLCIPLGNCV